MKTETRTSMFDKTQLLDAIATEIRVVRHLASRLPKGTLDWRPSASQRSTLELLQYLSTGSIDLTKAMLSGTWDVASVTAKAPKTLRFEEFDAAMERQERQIRALIEPLRDEDLANRPAMLPTGETTNLGASLINVVLRALVGYRMQLFLYAKASGNDSLTTANCWYGVDPT
jgi:hypothetical protein